MILDLSRSMRNTIGILTGITLKLQTNLRSDLLLLLRPPIHKHSYLLSSIFTFLEINNLHKGRVKLFHFSIFFWRINENVFPWYFLFLLSFWNATDIFFFKLYIQTLSWQFCAFVHVCNHIFCKQISSYLIFVISESVFSCLIALASGQSRWLTLFFTSRRMLFRCCP